MKYTRYDDARPHVLSLKALGFLVPLKHWGVPPLPSLIFDPDILEDQNLEGL